MTVIVGFYCTDGVVIASDSMLTPSLDGIGIGHHQGKKVHLLRENQIISFSGDFGLAARFRMIAEDAFVDIHPSASTEVSPLSHCVKLSQETFIQFESTGLKLAEIDLGMVLAFPHKSGPQCCVFESQVQPRLLDKHQHYVALGSGKMSADPFLRFLHDIFIVDWNWLALKEALLLAIWTVEHVIDTNPGGVAGPIQMASLSMDGGKLVAKEYEPNEIRERSESVKSAVDALRAWRDLVSGETQRTVDIPPVPQESPRP